MSRHCLAKVLMLMNSEDLCSIALGVTPLEGGSLSNCFGVLCLDVFAYRLVLFKQFKRLETRW